MIGPRGGEMTAWLTTRRIGRCADRARAGLWICRTKRERMLVRHFQSGLTVFCIFVAVSYARADLLWDNFLTPPNGFDDTRVWSSEQDTTVPTGSWTVDDANLGSVTVQSIRWAGARLENHSYSAEVIILNSQFGRLERRACAPARPRRETKSSRLRRSHRSAT